MEVLGLPKRVKVKEAKSLENESPVQIRGRIKTIRTLKNFYFVDIQEENEVIQICIDRRTQNGIDPMLIVGNIVDIEGSLGISKTGKKTVFVERVDVVAICSNQLFEKQFPLTTTDERFKNRIPDILQHREVRDFIMAGSKVKNSLRMSMCQDGFLEFETGLLHRQFDAGLAKPFVTKSNALEATLFLRLTAEIRLKMLIAAGIESVFEIGPSFRNEGMNHIYHPEFTLLEGYSSAATVEQLKEMFQRWIQTVVRDVNVNEGTKIVNDETEIEFGGDWPSIPFYEAIQGVTGDRVTSETSTVELMRIFQKHGEEQYDDKMPASTMLLKFFNHHIAPAFSNPMFVSSMPISACSPFVARDKTDPALSRSSWLAIDGLVVGDFYEDENNHQIVEERLKEQAKETGGTINKDFINCLKYGLPPTAGMGVGINRLLLSMRPAGIKKDIKETILFPNQ